MNYLPTDTSPAVIEDMKELVHLRLATAASRAIMEEVFTLLMISKGINLEVAIASIDIPHGVEVSDYRKQVRNCFIETVLGGLGISVIRVVPGGYAIVSIEAGIQGYFSLKIDSRVALKLHLMSVKNFNELAVGKLREIYPKDTQPIVYRVFVDKSRDELRPSIQTISTWPRVSDINKFYPYMSHTPAKLWEEFEKSNSNILLLIGPPGTGKSNFITQMLAARGWEKRTYLADQDSVLQRPDLVDYIRGLDDGSVMVTEDSDKMVEKRTNGNSMMSALLNATSGIASTNVKLIISTNLASLKDVDEALIREGRTFKILKFRLLDLDEALELRRSMNLPEVELEGKEFTLARTLNYIPLEEGDVRKPTPMGFGLK